MTPSPPSSRLALPSPSSLSWSESPDSGRTRQQAERDEAVVARNQLDWLAQMSTNADLDKLWVPEGMEVEECMQLRVA
jgi:hypothetical protein